MQTAEPWLSLFPDLIEHCRPDKPVELPGKSVEVAVTECQIYLFPILVYDADAVTDEDVSVSLGVRELYNCPEQLSFEFFLDDSIPHISKYISSRRNGLLDRQLLSFCARDPRLEKISFALYELGATRIGHVVQMSRQDLKDKVSASDAIVDRLQRRLQAAGLDLGMKTLGWNPGQSHSGSSRA